jgi:Ricin-type beta-trefoil lectin domain
MSCRALSGAAAAVVAVVLGTPFAHTAAAGTRLTTQFTPGKCLDIVNDGKNNRLIMAACGRYSGQDWSATRINDSSGYKIRNQFSGPNKCLDVINDGKNDKVIMADCGNFTGQNWSIPAAGKTGAFRNAFTGNAKCLDIVNDGQNNKLVLATCGNYTGQKWSNGPF